MAFASDLRLKEWVASVVPASQVSFLAPSNKGGSEDVGIYLMDVVQVRPPSMAKRAPLQIDLRYLVTAGSSDPQDAHERLLNLMFAAMDNADFEVELSSVPLSLWESFGVSPQPSFVLRMPLRQHRDQPPRNLITESMKLESSIIVGFYGLLLGPGGSPLSDCRIELPSLNLSTRTDYKGRFNFPGVPSTGRKQLIVRAKGAELVVESDQDFTDSGSPLIVHFDPTEG
jgi:hypothetical protein